MIMNQSVCLWTRTFLGCEGILQIQKWYVILTEENLGFYLDIHLSASLENV